MYEPANLAKARLKIGRPGVFQIVCRLFQFPCENNSLNSQFLPDLPMMTSMEIIVGYTSALQYWRLVGPGYLGDYREHQKATRRAREVMAAKERPRLVGGNRRPAGCALPICALVGCDDARTRTSSVVGCVWSALPEKSVVGAGEDFLMSTPEFCFLQMARRLSLVGLIQLGFELCGTYALVEGGPAVRRPAPLTSVAKLRTFVEATPNVQGRAKALRALQYVLNGSASPMETALAMLLCLPYGLGGYALLKPVLNHRIDVPPRLRKLADRGYCECDLCWPGLNLCLEYDSKLYHADPERQESDARRRSTLLSLGVTAVTVTRGQVMDSGAFNRLAHQLAKRMGKRLRYQDPGFTRKHCEMRAELFDSFGSLPQASQMAGFDDVDE